MFAKRWMPGDGKTSLASRLGPARAAQCSRLFVETLTRRLAAVADQRILCYAPPGSEAEFRALASDDWQLEPQASGDLGVGLRQFFEHALARAERVVVISGNCPDLPLEYVTQAFTALETRDVVLGPARADGYYLVGAARKLAPVFDGVPWSQAEVWPQTIARLEALQTSWHMLPAWYVVDSDQNLHTLLLNANMERFHDSHLAQLEARLLELLDESGRDA